MDKRVSLFPSNSLNNCSRRENNPENHEDELERSEINAFNASLLNPTTNSAPSFGDNQFKFSRPKSTSFLKSPRFNNSSFSLLAGSAGSSSQFQNPRLNTAPSRFFAKGCLSARSNPHDALRDRTSPGTQEESSYSEESEQGDEEENENPIRKQDFLYANRIDNSTEHKNSPRRKANISIVKKKRRLNALSGISKQLRKHIAVLLRENVAEEKEYLALQDTIQQLESDLASAVDEKHSLKEHANELQSKVSDLQRQKLKNESDLRSLQENHSASLDDLSIMWKRRCSFELHSRLEREYYQEALQCKEVASRKSNAAADQVRRELEYLKSKFHDEVEKNGMLEKKMQAVETRRLEQCNSYAETVKQLNEKIQESENSCRHHQRSITEKDADINALTRKLEETSIANRELDQRLKEFQKNNSILERKMEAVSKQADESTSMLKEQLTRNTEEAENAIANFRQELENLKSLVVEKEKENQQMVTAAASEKAALESHLSAEQKERQKMVESLTKMQRTDREREAKAAQLRKDFCQIVERHGQLQDKIMEYSEQQRTVSQVYVHLRTVEASLEKASQQMLETRKFVPRLIQDIDSMIIIPRKQGRMFQTEVQEICDFIAGMLQELDLLRRNVEEKKKELEESTIFAHNVVMERNKLKLSLTELTSSFGKGYVQFNTDTINPLSKGSKSPTQGELEKDSESCGKRTKRKKTRIVPQRLRNVTEPEGQDACEGNASAIVARKKSRYQTRVDDLGEVTGDGISARRKAPKSSSGLRGNEGEDGNWVIKDGSLGGDIFEF